MGRTVHVLTEEQKQDHRSVWERMAKEVPEFLPEYDINGNWHAVREIVLGGSEGWAGVWKRFTPRPETLVMDIGANAGLFSIFCALKGSSVVAYEPSGLLYAELMVLSAQHKIEKLYLQHCAIGGSNRIARHIMNESTLLGPFATYNGGIDFSGAPWTQQDSAIAESVPCVTLEYALDGLFWHMVKIDIEGAEAEVILACPEKVLERIAFCYIEFHPWIPEADYREMMDKLGRVFHVEGIPRVDGVDRWEAAYLTRKT